MKIRRISLISLIATCALFIPLSINLYADSNTKDKTSNTVNSIYTENYTLYKNGLYGWPLSMVRAQSIIGKVKFGGLKQIGIIDTGVDFSNPFLSSSRTPIDSSSSQSDDTHGTMVAGILAADGNGLSTPRGILPKVKLISIKVGSTKGISINDLINGIKRAEALHLKIVNISLGTKQDSPELKEVVEHAIENGMCIVAAAGDDGTNTIDYPAAYPGVIAVAATDDNGTLIQQTNYNNQTVAAPGKAILTTISGNQNDDIGWFTGSSAATPIVTGLSDVLLSINPSISPNQIKSIISETAQQGGGVRIVDFDSAYQKAIKEK